MVHYIQRGFGAIAGAARRTFAHFGAPDKDPDFNVTIRDPVRGSGGGSAGKPSGPLREPEPAESPGRDVSDTHFEPFLHVVDVTHDRALIAWGGFFFHRSTPDRQWAVVDDEDLHQFDSGRAGSIGESSTPYGDAVVEAYDAAGSLAARSHTSDANHVWLEGLAPDTAYTYRVRVNGEPWAEGERWDWGPVARGGLDLARRGGFYRRQFRTHPAPDTPASLTFAVIGDFGIGVTEDTEPARRQRRIAAVLDRLVADHGVRLVLTVGDNVYLTQLGGVEEQSGSEDDDWYASFYAAYRYALARVPVYPAVGNHDSGETEQSDDRNQLFDNLYIESRFRDTDEDGRATTSPGLNYRVGYGADIEFVSIDTTETSGGVRGDYFFQYPEHRDFLQHSFPEGTRRRWTIPFFHHPPYCAGPVVQNNQAMLEHLLPLFRRAGVMATFAGHEHNFQISRVDDAAHVVTGAGAKLREDPPDTFADAGTEGWAIQAHCLLVEIEGDQMTITPVAGLGPDGEFQVMTALSADYETVYPPFIVSARLNQSRRSRLSVSSVLSTPEAPPWRMRMPTGPHLSPAWLATYWH